MTHLFPVFRPDFQQILKTSAQVFFRIIRNTYIVENNRAKLFLKIGMSKNKMS